MKGIQKKIVLAGFVAIFAFIVTIGSTYAWYTITTENTVDTLSVTVQAQQSLLIMMDDDEAHSGAGLNLVDDAAYLNNPANYVVTLTNAIIDLEYDLEAIVLQPLTTMNGRTMTWRDLSNTGITGAYVEFNIWVLSQTGAVNVAIQDLALAADNTPAEKNAVLNAARLSIYDGTLTSIYGLDKDYTYTDGIGSLSAENITTITGYHGIYYTTGTEVALESTETLSSATTAIALAASTPQRVTIRIWIEGWDSECTNNLSAAIFTMGFSLSVK